MSPTKGSDSHQDILKAMNFSVITARSGVATVKKAQLAKMVQLLATCVFMRLCTRKQTTEEGCALSFLRLQHNLSFPPTVSEEQ